jgi:hypothetical protein
MSNYKIDCSGIPATAVLAALYNYAKPVGLGVLHYRPEVMTVEDAEKHLKALTGFDYLLGRPIKVDFRHYPILNVKHYDEDQGGEGTANQIIQELRTTLKQVKSPKVQSPLLSQVQPDAKLTGDEINGSIVAFFKSKKDPMSILFQKQTSSEHLLRALVDVPELKPFDEVYFCQEFCKELKAHGIPYPNDWHMFLSRQPGNRYNMIGSMGGRFVVDGTRAIVAYVNCK